MTDENETYELDPTAPPVPLASEAPSTPVLEKPAPVAEPAPRPASETVAVPAAPLRPLVRTARVEWPLTVAGCSLVLYIVGCLAGQTGVAPPKLVKDVLQVPSIADRMQFALKGSLRVGLLALCLVVGAYFLQLLDRRPVGDIRALLARMLAIASIALLAMFLPIDTTLVKQIYDAIVPFTIVWLSMVLLFRISLRDAGVILLGAIIALTVLYFGSLIVDFAVR